jgi:hypothetical protein
LGKLASTAIGGLAALAALLVLRNARLSQPDPRSTPPLEELLVIHAAPRYDTPPAQSGPPRTKLLVLPVTSAS